MRLEIYRAIWGVIKSTGGDLARSPHIKLETALPALKALGYDGIELPLKTALQTPNFKKMMSDNDLKIIFQIFTDGPVAPGSNDFGGAVSGFTPPIEGGESDKKQIVDSHMQIFKEQVDAAQEFSPTLINSHSLKDYFTRDMAFEWFSKALSWQKTNKYQVHHEGHRKRFLHSPWVARDFLPEFPELKFVADFSHWINVAETDTNDLDLTQVIEDVSPQVYHTHCRVGYDHGPQVSDPRAPEWLSYTEGHERWWDAIWKAQAVRNQHVSTMTPEHGPPNYQQTNPHNMQPLAYIWDINHWIGLRRQKRFAELFGEENTSKLVPSDTQDEFPTTFPGDSILKKHGRVGFI